MDFFILIAPSCYAIDSVLRASSSGHARAHVKYAGERLICTLTLRWRELASWHGMASLQLSLGSQSGEQATSSYSKTTRITRKLIVNMISPRKTFKDTTSLSSQILSHPPEKSSLIDTIFSTGNWLSLFGRYGRVSRS